MSEIRNQKSEVIGQISRSHNSEFRRAVPSRPISFHLSLPSSLFPLPFSLFTLPSSSFPLPSAFRGQKSEVRDQKSEVRSQSNFVPSTCRNCFDHCCVIGGLEKKLRGVSLCNKQSTWACLWLRGDLHLQSTPDRSFAAARLLQSTF